MTRPLLLTAYLPFQGRALNGSSTLLTWAKRHQARWSDHYQTHILLLPVEWERAIYKLRSAIIRLKPHRILSMGEGRPGRIAWEQRAVNYARGTDEINRGKDGQISAKHPPHIHAAWDIDFSAVQSPLPIVQSEDCGEFLCNRLLWESIDSIGGGCGFLHLPPQGETPNVAYIKQVQAALEHVLSPTRIRKDTFA